MAQGATVVQLWAQSFPVLAGFAVLAAKTQGVMMGKFILFAFRT